jgi:hypothetical protein
MNDAAALLLPLLLFVGYIAFFIIPVKGQTLKVVKATSGEWATNPDWV